MSDVGNWTTVVYIFVLGSFNLALEKVIGRKRHFRVSHRCLRSAAESLPDRWETRWLVEMARMGIHGSRVWHWSQGANRIQKKHISVSDAFAFFFRLAMWKRVWDIYFWNESLNLQPWKKTTHFSDRAGWSLRLFFLQLDDGSMSFPRNICQLTSWFQGRCFDGLRSRWLSELEAAAYDEGRLIWDSTRNQS